MRNIRDREQRNGTTESSFPKKMFIVPFHCYTHVHCRLEWNEPQMVWKTRFCHDTFVQPFFPITTLCLTAIFFIDIDRFAYMTFQHEQRRLGTSI